MTTTHALVMAKSPVAGTVKTRLCPPCSPEEAATIAAAALADTLDAVAACTADVKVLALAGPIGPWVPEGFAVVPQRGDGFAARLVSAWQDAAALSGGVGIQIGMDTPQVATSELDALLGLVATGRAVLGPATDGGWWAIGLPGTDPADVFTGIPLSTDTTGARQLARMAELGLNVVTARPLTDIDNVGDLHAVAAEIPMSRTGRAAADVLGRAAVA